MLNEVPTAESVASMPKKERRSAESRARYFEEQFQLGLDIRRRHAHQWMRIKSIMSGAHYFRINFGQLEMLPKKAGTIRAIFPLMDPLYLWGAGRLNSNEVGVTAVPANGQGSNSFYRASRAQDILTSWIDEVDIPSVFDEMNQYLLFYGMAGLLRHADKFRKNVFIHPVSGTELFPIPYDARNVRELEGIMRVAMVPKQWLEMQDDRPSGLAI